jgi:Sensors of blue-light using FAD
MPLIQLIYTSRPFGFDDLALSGILAAAHRNNVRDGITGSLICREDIFMQMLEGPEDKVKATFDRISRDDRHTSIGNLWTSPIENRLFPEWAMRHDPAQSWMWTRDDVTAGALDNATHQDLHAIFVKLAAMPPAVPQTCPFTGADVAAT